MSEEQQEPKRRFCATGFVELGVDAEIKNVRTASGALKKAKENRGGAQNINWEDGNWESSVQAICIVDCDTNEKLECE